jgi:hypothetical protein
VIAAVAWTKATRPLFESDSVLTRPAVLPMIGDAAVALAVLD